MDDFPMNPPIDDGVEKKINDNSGKIADCLRDGHSVVIRPCKNGIKFATLNEKVIK